MNLTKVSLIALLVIFLGYLLYLGVGMSSTYPAIKEYSFRIKETYFIEKITDRVNSIKGWSMKKTDSVRGKYETCYWSSLLCEENGQKLEYDIKHCLGAESNEDDSCVELEVIGAFDHNNKSGGYRLSDKDVKELLNILDRAILSELAPACSDNP